MLTAAIVALAAAPLAATAETVLGLYVFHRHGDRTTKAWPPTSLTALGADQVFASGGYFRSRYVGANATNPVLGLSGDLAVLSQLSVTSPVDTVLQNSAQVFLQALYPPAGSAARQTLANGTVTEAPLGGYQYVPVNAVQSAASAADSEHSAWLQGNSGCGRAVTSSNNYFASREYLETLASTKDFYASLTPVLNTTFSDAQINFKNAYSIWDLIHVSTIHNATIPSSDLLTPPALLQVRTRADQHEFGLAYNASDPVRAIAGAVLAAQIVAQLNTSLLHATDTAPSPASRLGIQFGAYGTFLSFFGLAGLPASLGPDWTGVVDYASSMAFELVTNATTVDRQPVSPDDVGVRFLFSNGSAAETGGLRAFPLFGRAETVIPWNTFQDEMRKFAIGDTADWCATCGNTTGICAGTASDAASSSDSSGSGGGGGVSTPVAGVIGALVTLVVVLGAEALVMAAGGLRVVKKGIAARGKAAEAGA